MDTDIAETKTFQYEMKYRYSNTSFVDADMSPNWTKEQINKNDINIVARYLQFDFIIKGSA